MFMFKILALKTSYQWTPMASLVWRLTGQPKVVLRTTCPTNSDQEFEQIINKAAERNICTSLIYQKVEDKDKQQTSESAKTVVMAVGPGPVKLIDQITGNLKLY